MNYLNDKAMRLSPGFDAEIVRWCVENDVTITPGCVTPTEIMAALKMGLTIVKFFPANIYGGLSAMKNLAAPFGTVKFIPTGGINLQNIAEYAAAPFVHTVCHLFAYAQYVWQANLIKKAETPCVARGFSCYR